jgi:CheY-like chemotaxis protein
LLGLFILWNNQRRGLNNETMPAILIVDDNPIQAVTRRLILEKAHFSVSLAESGAAALEKFKAGEPFGMVITDHCMPEMGGPELVNNLREMSSTLPIVVLSGLPEAEAEYEGKEVYFRLKPIQPEELIELTRTLLFPPYFRTA